MILDLFKGLPTSIISAMRNIFFIGILLVTFQHEARGQQANGVQDIPGTSAGIIVQSTDFRFDGTVPSEVAFRFDGLAYGLFYKREAVQMMVTRGAQSIGPNDDLVLTDFTLSGLAKIRPWDKKGNSKIEPFFPVGLQSNYRRIKRTQENVEIDAFEYTVVAIGSGLGVAMPLGKGRLVSKGMAFYGIANRSFSNNTDTSAIVEASVVWSSVRLTERFGFEVGYNYRWQKWYSDIGQLTGSSYNFIGSHHAVQVGLSF